METFPLKLYHFLCYNSIQCGICHKTFVQIYFDKRKFECNYDEIWRFKEMGKRFKMRQRFGYGAADMGSNFVWSMITTYLAVFYTDVAGIGAVTVGMIMLISKFVDACTDVMMGVIVDRTRTRWGKCRPYFLFGAIPLAFFAIITFYMPNFDSNMKKVIYAFVKKS